jgi:hypothetical protein
MKQSLEYARPSTAIETIAAQGEDLKPYLLKLYLGNVPAGQPTFDKLRVKA